MYQLFKSKHYSIQPKRQSEHSGLRFDASSLAIIAIVFQTSLASQNHVVELLFRGEKASEPDVRFNDFPINTTRSAVLDNLGHQVINDSVSYNLFGHKKCTSFCKNFQFPNLLSCLLFHTNESTSLLSTGLVNRTRLLILG